MKLEYLDLTRIFKIHIDFNSILSILTTSIAILHEAKKYILSLDNWFWFISITSWWYFKR